MTFNLTTIEGIVEAFGVLPEPFKYQEARPELAGMYGDRPHWPYIHGPGFDCDLGGTASAIRPALIVAAIKEMSGIHLEECIDNQWRDCDIEEAPGYESFEIGVIHEWRRAKGVDE